MLSSVLLMQKIRLPLYQSLRPYAFQTTRTNFHHIYNLFSKLVRFLHYKIHQIEL